MKRRAVRLVLFALLIAGGIYGWRAGWFGGAEAAPTIGGNVEVREVQLAFRVGGRIAVIAVDEGDSVAPGQLLARLDGAPFADAMASARAEIDALKARQKAVEDLQTNRNIPVHLLNELVKQTPEGVYLRDIKQAGQVVTLNGVAQVGSAAPLAGGPTFDLAKQVVTLQGENEILAERLRLVRTPREMLDFWLPLL
ncbi:MAG: biotin/lipoyl-binding protein, partial [Sphingopyxis sp.]|nr:biotin/lipoyl-binding protein [Sphingopyxis sp.]